MKRALAFLAVLLLASSGLSALEWGGTLDNTSTLSYAGASQDLGFQQQDVLALWLEAALGPRFVLTAQGSYTYAQDRPYLFDVDLLRLQGRYPLKDSSVLELSLGRFHEVDFSGLLFDDNLDGVKLEWRRPRANLALDLGYLGLEMRPNSDVSMSWGDLNDDSLWAPRRLLEMLRVELPELRGGSGLLLALVAQQDLRSEEDLLQEGDTVFVSGQGGRLSTEYLGAAWRSSLARGLYYDLFGYLGTGRTLSYIDGTYSYEWIVSGLLGGSLRYFRSEWLSSRAELRLILTTGDEDFADTFVEGNQEGLATVFTAISQPELTLLFSPRLGNLAFAEASYSIKPMAVLQTQLKVTAFLRPTLGPVSDSRVDPGSSSRYLGTELEAIARLRLLSDLGLVFTAGTFLPGSAFRSAYREADFGGRIELSLAF